MPLQNRVDPFGTITAQGWRGAMMGNRGIIHDPQTRTLLTKRWGHKAWIYCVLEFKNYQHPIMGESRYTELFFFDEVMALAAGHRPCAYCRRRAFDSFKSHWVAVNRPGRDIRDVKVAEIDAQLQIERVTRARQKVTYTACLSDLPSGIVFEIASTPILKLERELLPWGSGGYAQPIQVKEDADVNVLTPRSIVGAITNGYVPNCRLG
jgi:hypothetical protein